MGSGRAAVVGQRAELGVNRRARAAHLVAVHAITDARATAVPDQIEARKDEPGLDIAVEHVRPDGSAVLRHEAVREPRTARAPSGFRPRWNMPPPSWVAELRATELLARMTTRLPRGRVLNMRPPG